MQGNPSSNKFLSPNHQNISWHMKGRPKNTQNSQLLVAKFNLAPYLKTPNRFTYSPITTKVDPSGQNTLEHKLHMYLPRIYAQKILQVLVYPQFEQICNVCKVFTLNAQNAGT